MFRDGRRRTRVKLQRPEDGDAAVVCVLLFVLIAEHPVDPSGRLLITSFVCNTPAAEYLLCADERYSGSLEGEQRPRRRDDSKRRRCRQTFGTSDLPPL